MLKIAKKEYYTGDELAVIQSSPKVIGYNENEAVRTAMVGLKWHYRILSRIFNIYIKQFDYYSFILEILYFDYNSKDSTINRESQEVKMLTIYQSFINCSIQ